LAGRQFEGTRNVNVGRRLREIRTQRGLVIDDIAASTGLSRAYISQVETGKASPSLQALAKLADAVAVPVETLFITDDNDPQFIRAGDRQVLQFGDPDAPDGIRKLIQFMSSPSGNLELVQLEIPVGYTAGDGQHAHEGEEVLMVTKGRVTAVHGSKSYVLEVGDSMHWAATVPHMIQNAGEVPAVLVIARTPPGFKDMRFDELAKETTIQ